MTTDTQPKRYTRRTSEAGFPESLMVAPTGDILPLPDHAKWYVRHNRAVTDFIKSTVGATNGLQRQERAILGLCAGIETWIGSSGYGDDGLLGMEVTVPLVQAFRAALNGDCGRLDCGTLDEWAASTLERCGIDPDTGEWK